MSEEDEEQYEKYNICRFCEKEIIVDNIRDHCHLTGEYRGPAHNKCNIFVTKKQSIINIRNGEELTNLYLKSDVSLLPDVFEKYKKYLLWTLVSILCIL